MSPRSRSQAHLAPPVPAIRVPLSADSSRRSSRSRPGSRPSTFTVTNTLDNGDDAHPVPGSLRAAIVAANDDLAGATIDFNMDANDPGPPLLPERRCHRPGQPRPPRRRRPRHRHGPRRPTRTTPELVVFARSRPSR